MSGLIVFGIVCFLLILLSLLTVQVTEPYTAFNVGARMRCPTRNQSYDLRGDALPIQRTELLINNSGFGPLTPQDCVRSTTEIL